MSFRVVLIAAGLAVLASPGPALACAALTPKGEAMREHAQDRFLRKEADKRVRGTFAFEPGQADAYDEGYGRTGIVTTADGRRYRVTIRNEINCGFPYYYLQDGSAGVFYLKKSEYPDEDDLADGIFDAYDYVHFRDGRSD